MPDPKHARSDYSHWDSTAPDQWARLIAALQDIAGTVFIDGQPIVVSSDGQILSTIDVHTAAAFGLPLGYSIVSKFGRNLAIDNGATADIWTVGGVRTWLSTAETLEALSGSGLDDAGSSGATKITIQGLDDNWDNQEVEIIMDGANPVTLPGLWRRVNRAFCSEVGTYGGNNVGLITVRIDSAGATQTEILAGIGQTEQTHWSMARNYTGVITAIYMSTDSSKVIDATIWQHYNISDIVTPFAGAQRKIWGITGLQGGDQYSHVTHGLLTGPCDVWWEATSHAQGTEVEAGFDVIIKED